MKQVFSFIYSKPYFRIPLKFIISFCISKVIYDYGHYKIIGQQFGLFRFNLIFNGQNPINPPTPIPYPYNDTYEHLTANKQFNKHTKDTFVNFTHKFHHEYDLYNDLPLRQNPDSIDHFVQYGNIYRIREIIDYSFINKLKQEGIEIPQGINQKIRQLSQYKLEFHVPIVPQL